MKTTKAEMEFVLLLIERTCESFLLHSKDTGQPYDLGVAFCSNTILEKIDKFKNGKYKE